MIKRCNECRSEMEMTVSQPFESFGANEQVISIRCNGDKKINCPAGVARSFDADITDENTVIEGMIAYWNSLGD